MTTKYTVLDARPTKNFFVNMLTKDIEICDCILDLLDNCVDGVQRFPQPKATEQKPYVGKWAHIKFNGKEFEIHDNCGGIPWALKDYAWRMGKPAEAPPPSGVTVGQYGIGMKRAMFKLGRHALIETQSGKDAYDVEYDASWLDSDENWDLKPKQLGRTLKQDGTSIVITDLRPDIAEILGPKGNAFEDQLRTRIEEHYAVIITKGFRVTINNKDVEPKPVKLIFDDEVKMHPYFFKWDHNGLHVDLAVGLTTGIPTDEDLREERELPRYSRLMAGWTVICNDRVVVYCDRTELTGWAQGGVPAFHNQFIAIAGVVEFRSSNPALLPTQTTKRGVDAGSLVYLQVRERMIEGTKVFTDYTNWWKGKERAAKERVKDAKTHSIEEIKEKAERHLRKVAVPTGLAYRYKPELERPQKTTDERWIRFKKKDVDIRRVAAYLLGRQNANPSDVGEACFERIRKEARQ